MDKPLDPPKVRFSDDKKVRWDPTQYEKFRVERLQPFFDLAALIRPRPAMRIVDLGCGTAENSALLVESLADAQLDGIDSSGDMVASALSRVGPRLRVVPGDIAVFDRQAEYDLVFSNAALQWVPDHEALLPRLLDGMKPGAQIAVQVPKNELHPSHLLAVELETRPELQRRIAGKIQRPTTLTLERYAELLHQHGFRDQVCLEKIYGHELASSGEVVEWVKGTLLRPFLARLDDDGQRRFLDEYRERLIARIGDHSPYFYPFRRLLFWGEKQG